jgi:hypothetical protein
MIMGRCVYCDYPFMLEMPDEAPVFGRVTCETCGKTFWEHYTRVSPMAYTEEAFAELFVIDETTRSITKR